VKQLCFILGDLVGPEPKLSCPCWKRTPNPRRGELQPQCVVRLWDETAPGRSGVPRRSRAVVAGGARGGLPWNLLLIAVDQADMAWLPTCHSL